jgi:hypothetical protein
MQKFPGSIKVHVKVEGLPDAVQTSLMVKKTPEKTVEHLNKLAKAKGLPATYSLATEEEYWAYRNSLKTPA